MELNYDLLPMNIFTKTIGYKTVNLETMCLKKDDIKLGFNGSTIIIEEESSLYPLYREPTIFYDYNGVHEKTFYGHLFDENGRVTKVIINPEYLIMIDKISITKRKALLWKNPNSEYFHFLGFEGESDDIDVVYH
jgi:hypothetical protein